MMTLSIVPSDPALVELIGAMNATGDGAGLRNTERALSAISGSIARAWQGDVGSKYRIQTKKESPYNQKIYSEDDMVHWLEKGLPSYDMKATHTKGKKSRVVKPRVGRGGQILTEWKAKRKDGTEYTVHAGDSYLIIPMRHRTKGGKSEAGQPKTLEDVYPEVQKMMGEDFQRSKVTKSAQGSGKVSPNYWGESVERAEYSWGSRMAFPELDEFKNLQGMVVMGDSKQSSFLTFRVISVNSPADSWIHPGIEAKHYLENIVEGGQEKIQNVIEEALKRDFA